MLQKLSNVYINANLCNDEGKLHAQKIITKSYKTRHSEKLVFFFKKSESVTLELLDMQDLASLTVQKRHGPHSTGSASAAPLNFDLFKNDAASSDQTIPISHQNSNTCENMKNPQGKSPPPQIPPNALNKRKYLIVSYMAEFDKYVIFWPQKIISFFIIRKRKLLYSVINFYLSFLCFKLNGKWS